MYAVYYISKVNDGYGSDYTFTNMINVYAEHIDAIVAVDELNNGNDGIDAPAFLRKIDTEENRVYWKVRYDYHDNVDGAIAESVALAEIAVYERWYVSEGGELTICVFAPHKDAAIARAEQWRVSIRAQGAPGGKGMTWIIGNGKLPSGIRGA